MKMRIKSLLLYLKRFTTNKYSQPYDSHVFFCNLNLTCAAKDFISTLYTVLQYCIKYLLNKQKNVQGRFKFMGMLNF